MVVNEAQACTFTIIRIRNLPSSFFWQTKILQIVFLNHTVTRLPIKESVHYPLNLLNLVHIECL